jgi:protein-tyrosine-phosphatase/DNA-binding transcriptional ArsR family regulator
MHRFQLMYSREMTTDSAPPAILGLIADPHRWRLLAELARSDRRVGELTELVGKPQNQVSYHLAELRNAGLVTARRSSADRRDVYYRADLHRCRELLADASGDLHPGVRLAPTSTHLPATTPSRPPRVLFLCTGNSARSQIAEALLIERSRHTITARSAGSHPKELHPDAVRVMAERGIDIAGNATKHLRRFARMRFDRVITLCDKLRETCPDLPGASATAHWSIPDPATGTAGESTYLAFRQVADELEWRIDLLIDDLLARPTERNTHAR